ncbi:MAG: hypothetical protein QF464_14300, partial [Myxococcota bacterium]|nr:hypothetical protein [Myxococcota bacterium]
MTEPVGRPRRGPRGRVRRALGVLLLSLLYGGMAVWTTWPLVLTADDGLPLGTYENATVPYTMAWSLWWTGKALGGGLLSYFHAPIFHPMEYAFALSEPVPFLGLLLAPLSSIGASPALVHNVALWLALLLNGLAAYGLLSFLRLHWVSAVAGGAMMVMLPAVHQEIGSIAFTPLFGVLWTLRAMVRFSREPSWRRGAQVGLYYVMTFLLCMQYALFLALAALPSALVLCRLRHLKPRGLAGFGALLLVVAVFVGPLAYMHGSALSGEGVTVSPMEAAHGSASGLAWLTVPWRQFVMAAGIEVASEPGQTALFPGIFKLILACLGMLYGLRRRHLRRVTLFLLLVGAFGGFWSVAAGIFAGEDGLYALFQVFVPGLDHVANPWRAGILTQVIVVLLAALGLQRMLRTRLLVRRPGQGEPSPVRGLPIVVILAFFVVVELFPGAQRIETTPSLEAWRPVGDWVNENIPEGAPVAFAPVPINDDRAEFEEIARWMYLQPVFDRPMVNGFAPHDPVTHHEFNALMRGFPSPRANAALDARDVRWLVTASPVLKSRIVKEGPSTGWARMFT